MPSSNPSRASTAKVFSATVVAAASVVGLVAYFNGDTYQAGTHEATTISGATVTAGGGLQSINASGGRYSTLEADTVSGATIRSTNGLAVITNSLMESVTVSGATVRGLVLSGHTLKINAQASGSGKISVHGSDGGGTCFQDTDGAGWTTCEYLNGVETCTIANSTTCP